MARQKNTVYNRRLSFAIKEEDYQMFKAFANVRQQDIGTVIREIVEIYLTEHKEKFRRSALAMEELKKLRTEIANM